MYNITQAPKEIPPTPTVLTVHSCASSTEDAQRGAELAQAQVVLRRDGMDVPGVTKKMVGFMVI